MAYDKPLKIQWTEIDGRTVPLVLPQFWDEDQEDWVVSSEQNRLPVDAQLTGRYVSLVKINNADVEVASGESIMLFSGNSSKFPEIRVVFQSVDANDLWKIEMQRLIDGAQAFGLTETEEFRASIYKKFEVTSGFSIYVRNIRDQTQTIRRYEVGGVF